MGIKSLTQTLADRAPACIRETKVEHYVGKIVALDGTMMLNQFLRVVQHAGGDMGYDQKNAKGEETAHLSGFLSRISRFRSLGIKPACVFDGKPPALKLQEIKRRQGLRQEAQTKLDNYLLVQQRQQEKEREKEEEEEKNKVEAPSVAPTEASATQTDEKTQTDMDEKEKEKDQQVKQTDQRDDKQENDTKKKTEKENIVLTEQQLQSLQKRAKSITSYQRDQVITLLRLLGVPVIMAAGEGEAQCAAMCKAGLVDVVATEDLDTLTFGAPILVRGLMASESKKQPIREFHLSIALQGLNMNMSQFVDMCILAGCDYGGTIKGIGAKRAFDLLTSHHSLEKALASLDQDKHPIDTPLTTYQAIQHEFANPNILPLPECKALLRWSEPDELQVMDYLVNQHQFDPKRVASSLAKMKLGLPKQAQRGLDCFLTKQVSSSSMSSSRSATAKTKQKAQESVETHLKNKRKRPTPENSKLQNKTKGRKKPKQDEG